MSDFPIKELRILGLFGNLNHYIPLNDGGVTFIHGPNGCGKTTVLRLIAAIFSWDTSTLIEIDYASIEIVNTNGSILFFDRVKLSEDESEIKSPTLEFGFRNNDDCKSVLSRTSSDVKISPNEIEDYLPFLSRIGVREWLDLNTGVRFDYAELIERHWEKLPHTPTKKRPEWLSSYIEALNLHFIKTQRLLRVDYGSIRRHRSEDISVADVIQLYSNEIKELISKKLAEQAAVSQRHDRSFPERLLSLTIEDTVSESQIRDMYAETETKIEKLVDAGLIEKQQNISLPQKSLQEVERRVLSLYLQDVNIKLSVFDDLQKKIGIFLEIIGPKLRGKHFSVNRKDGFSVTLKYDASQPLAPSKLSSGEQHQIVLFYELIFKAEVNSFFLVDEPEISLHVDWQRRFMSDIKKVATLGDRNFLIATHSPQIIGSHRELAVRLDEGILE